MAPGDLTVVGSIYVGVKASTPKLEGITNAEVVTNLNADKVDGADRSTDGTFAGNSDALVPSQKAAKTYIDTKDAANVKLTGDQTVAGVKTFSSIPALPASNPTTDNQASRKAYVDGLDAANVKLTGNQTVAGIKTFSSIPVLPASDPAAANEATRKAYVNAQDALKASQASLDTHIALQAAGIHGSTVAATANKIPHRDNNGRILGGSPLLHIRDEKNAGTEGGSSVAAWTKRVLNTVKTNEIDGASLSDSQITLPAGTYEIQASAPALRAGMHKLRLRNITDGTDALIGNNAEEYASDTTTTHAFLFGRLTIAGSKVFELQHRVSSAYATMGFGMACDFDVVEVYGEIIIRKIS